MKSSILNFILLLVTLRVWAGGGPQNVLVVVNDRSVESQQLGKYYQQLRHIPDRNICHVSASPTNESLAWNAFRTTILNPIVQHMQRQGLTNQIDYIVLCKEIPSRVNNIESSTAVVFYGFKNAPAYPPCSMPANTANAYYKSERAFRHMDRYGYTNCYLTFLLTARNLSEALTNTWRCASADGSKPGGSFFLLAPPGDSARNIRYRLYDNQDFTLRFFPDLPRCVLRYSDYIKNQTNVLGYMTGRTSVPGETNGFVAGAISDHLTSTGGYLPDGLGQGTVWDWISRGSGLSYGTVSEPCAILEKFPDPMVFYWYARGFSAGESYYMSVANPYQGLFVGDPLTAPFADPPVLSVSGLTNQAIVSGIVTVTVTAVANPAGVPVAAIDLYVDDLFVQSLTNVTPRAGNNLYAVINSVTCRYTTVNGDSLYSAVEGLAASINASNLAVYAYPFGDRIQLVYTNYGWPGTGITCAAGAHIGFAIELTLAGQALSTNLLDSVYAGREYIACSAYTSSGANTGDTVTCTITLINGVVSTQIVIATQNEQPSSILGRLQTAINSDPVLQATNGLYANSYSYYPVTTLSLEPRTPGPTGQQILIDYQVQPVIPGSGLQTNDSFVDQINDNQSDLTARGQLLFTCGLDPLPVSFVWNSAAWPNGSHVLHFVCRDGSAVETQGHLLIPVVISNSPLICALTAPTNKQAIVLTNSLLLEADTADVSGAVTQLVFMIEGKIVTILTGAPFQDVWNTTNSGVGSTRVCAFAYDTAGQAAISESVVFDILMSPDIDSDEDGMADAWEQYNFGGLYVYGATNDPDGDWVGNIDEYIADTQPTNPTDYFHIADLQPAEHGVSISFLSSSSRVYYGQFNNAFSVNEEAWQEASGPFPGNGSLTNWLDDGSETGGSPSVWTQRLYRIRPSRP